MVTLSKHIDKGKMDKLINILSKNNLELHLIRHKDEISNLPIIIHNGKQVRVYKHPFGITNMLLPKEDTHLFLRDFKFKNPYNIDGLPEYYKVFIRSTDKDNTNEPFEYIGKENFKLN